MKVAVWRGLDSRGLGGKVLRAFIMQVSAWGCPGEDKEQRAGGGGRRRGRGRGREKSSIQNDF